MKSCSLSTSFIYEMLVDCSCLRVFYVSPHRLVKRKPVSHSARRAATPSSCCSISFGITSTPSLEEIKHYIIKRNTSSPLHVLWGARIRRYTLLVKNKNNKNLTSWPEGPSVAIMATIIPYCNSFKDSRQNASFFKYHIYSPQNAEWRREECH